MGKQFTIPNLMPDKAYALQVRAVDNGEPSNWSRKYSVTTINDATQGTGGASVTPSAPTLSSWSTSSVGYTAVWTAVTQTTGGQTSVTSHYDLEFADTGTGTTKIWKFYSQAKPTVTVTLSLAEMKAILGGNPGTITLRVRAVSSAGTLGAWSNSLATTMGVPDPPTSVVVTEAIDQIKLSWTAPVNQNYVDGYRVYTGASSGFTPSATNRIYQGAATQFAFTSATYSLQYFKVCSYNEGGTESTYVLASGTPKTPFNSDTTAPAVPGLSGNLSTASTTPRFAELTWTFNAGSPGNEDIAGFVVAWQKVGDTNWKQNFYEASARAGSIELPLPYASYSFKIASFDKVANYSAFSTVLSLDGTIPGAPAQVTGVASTASLDMFRITWTANTEADVVNGGVYNVDIATNNTFSTGLQSYTTGNNFIEIASLAPNTQYFYRVRAVDVGGTAGAYSTTGNRTTPNYAPTKSDGSAPSTSPTPSLVAGIGYITANWTRVTNNDLVTYEVHISTTTGFTPSGATLVAETTGTTVVIRTLADKTTALSYGTTYFIKIVAKDADGSAAASTQASTSPLQAVNADIADVSAGKLTAGTITSGTIILGSGGIFRTNNSDVIITDTGITVGANSNISASAMQAGTAFVDDLTVQSTFNVSTGGILKSSNYVAGTTGWQLTNTTLDIRSGTVAAGTLVAGTITSSGISVGAGGVISVDSSGIIRSNNYAAGSTGWRMNSSGIEMNDAGSQISAAAIKTSSIGAVTITVGSGGAIRSANWNGTSTGFSLSDTGLTMYTGTIQGAAVYTNAIASLATDPNSPLTPIPGQSQGAAFGINASGKAVFSGALVYGNTVMGNGTSHYVQSGNYVAGTSGWLIRGDGYAEFANLAVYGSATVTGTMSSSTAGWTISGNGSASFTNADMKIGNTASGTIYLLASSGNGQIRLYPAGQVAGVSSTYHFIRPSGNDLQINGAFGALVHLRDTVSIGGVGSVPNCVVMSVNAHVSNNMYVDNVLTVINGQVNTPHITVSGELRGDPQFLWVGTGTINDAEFGTGGKLRRKTSSLRYKENVRALGLDVQSILALEPKKFQWKEKTFYGSNDDAGFIAEEAHALGLYEFVTYDDQGRPDSFRYSNYTAALQAVVRSQQAELDELRTRIENLEA